MKRSTSSAAPTRGSRRALAGFGIAAFAVLIQGEAAAPPDNSPAPLVATSAARTVTLITGDKVRTSSAAGDALSIEPRSGRGQLTFLTYIEPAADGTRHTYVIPQDAQPLIAAGKLDRGLFDVTNLLAFNYDDANADSLPLIVTYEEGTTRQQTAASVAGASVRQSLPIINGVALAAPTEDIGQLWDTMTATARAAGVAGISLQLSGTVEKIWLDGLAQPLLDRSAPQIGAPEVWAGGYQGEGVVVAIVDTGVDATHPDLAGKIIAERDFTGGADGRVAPFSDTVGHGTHVAATVAGSGVASGGKYRGVAPGAQLLSAKVCASKGCEYSWIIAGMTWAVTQEGARIVNMSLGGQDLPEIDPMEEAVNRLTADYGTLFVVSAGNSGPSALTIGSPATADAALAVGAVDRSGQMAPFSSRGPRWDRDKSLKPEITAPGVGIVAARASGTAIGSPLDDAYTALSGTSMAAPHVAGAAALLVQRHPHWSPQQLKAALIGSARPTAATSVYAQGAGRVDVAAAFRTNVLAEPSVLSLGIASWPHQDDETVTRVVTYRNVGAAAVDLTLSFEVAGPGGKAPPAGMFRVQPATLSVPTGGTASATVRVDTRINAAVGVYEGRLIARTGAAKVSIPLVIEREEEKYDLTLSYVGPDGAPMPANAHQTVFTSADRSADATFHCPPWSYSPDAWQCAVRLPPGRYGVYSLTFVPRGPAIVLAEPAYVMNRMSAEYVFDARQARRVTVNPPTPTAQAFATKVGFWYRGHGGESGAGIFHFGGLQSLELYTATLGKQDRRFESFVAAQWEDSAGLSAPGDSPTLHDAAWSYAGRLPPSALEPPRREKAALVRARYEAGLLDSTSSQVGSGAAPDYIPAGLGLLAGAVPRELPVPTRRKEYYYSNEQTITWWHILALRGADQNTIATFDNPPTAYRAQREYSTRFGEPPYAPAFPPGSNWVERVGDRLRVITPLFGDRAGHAGEIAADSTRLALYHNGSLLRSLDDVQFPISAQFSVPPAPATYRLEATATQQLVNLSRRVDAAWTFESAHVDGDTVVPMPLVTVRFDPPVNARGEAYRGRKLEIPVTVRQLRHRHGSDSAQESAELAGTPDRPEHGSGKHMNLQVEVSFDDGASWRRVPVERRGQQWSLVLRHPARAEYVSLRAVADDYSGNRVEQTTIRAYRLIDPS